MPCALQVRYVLHVDRLLHEGIMFPCVHARGPRFGIALHQGCYGDFSLVRRMLAGVAIGDDYVVFC